MRITETMRYQSLLHDISAAQDRILKAQEQVTSGKKVSKPSDDPVAASDIIRLNSEKYEAAQYEQNLTFAQSRLQVTDGVLDTVQQVIERARTLGQLAFNNTAGANSYATELDSLREQLISTANTSNGGRFLFGGSVTTKTPYTKNPDSTVTYNGDTEGMPVSISRTATVETQIPGSDVFSGTVNIFQVMSDLSTAVTAGNKDGIDAQLKKIDQFADQISAARTKVGGYLNFVTNVESGLSAAKLARENQLSQEEAADMAASISELTMAQNGLQATLSVGARISQLSILDYLK